MQDVVGRITTLISKELKASQENKEKKSGEYLLGKNEAAFMQTAKNISYSRRVARAHYKSDSNEGDNIGNSMFNFIKNKI